MANDINNVTLTGRLTKDSELKHINNTEVINFSIAVNRYAGKDKEDTVSFFDIQMWGNYGKSINDKLVKGLQVTISGELQQQRWEKDGNARSKVVINAGNIKFSSNVDSNGSTGSQNQSYKKSDNTSGSYNKAPTQAHSQFAGPEQFDDDIPF